MCACINNINTSGEKIQCNFLINSDTFFLKSNRLNQNKSKVSSVFANKIGPKKKKNSNNMDQYQPPRKVDLPEIVSFSTERNNRAIGGAALISSKSASSQKFVIGESIASSSDGNKNGKSNKPSVLLATNQQQPQKIATTLGSIACTLQRQHERDRRIADVNDVRGAIPVPVSRKSNRRGGGTGSPFSNNSGRGTRSDDDDEDANDHDDDKGSFQFDDHNVDVRHSFFDRSVSLEVRRLLLNSRQKKFRLQQRQQAQSEKEKEFVEQQMMMIMNQNKSNKQNTKTADLDLQKALDESSMQFLEALASSPSSSPNNKQDENEKEQPRDDEEQEEEQEEYFDDNEEEGQDEEDEEVEETVVEVESGRGNNKTKVSTKQHKNLSAATNTTDTSNTSTDTNGNNNNNKNYSRPSSYTSSTRILSSDELKRRDSQLNNNNTNSVVVYSEQTTSFTSPTKPYFLKNNSTTQNQNATSLQRLMNSFGEPRKAKMDLFQNQAFKNPIPTRTTPIQQLQGKTNNQISPPKNNNNNNNKSPTRNMSFGLEHSASPASHIVTSSSMTEQEESPLSRQRRRFETLRYKNEIALLDSSAIAPSESFKSPSAAQYTYKRTFQSVDAPPMAEVPGAFTRKSLLNANSRGGVASNDGTVPHPQAGKSVEELLHPTHKYRRGSGTMMQTSEGRKMNDKMAETCIVRRDLVDDNGKQITVWPSVTVLGAGMRNEGKRLAATLKKFRTDFAKTSSNFWSEHPTPPRRPSLIEQQIAFQRRQNQKQQMMQNGDSVAGTHKKWVRPPSGAGRSEAVYAKEDGDFGYRPIVQ